MTRIGALSAADREKSSARIARDIDVLSRAPYTLPADGGISRYAYTEAYAKTVGYFRRELVQLGFSTYEDCVGNFIARNCPAGETVFGIGSHCDSIRNGGRYDGALGVATAVEVCRLNVKSELELPLQVISFLEEEGSAFGQTLLGSRIAAQRISESELRALRAVDDDRSFWEHASEAGYEPARWQESRRVLDDLAGWLELHIEQGRVLEERGKRIGVVDAIAGYIHADLAIVGRADHAGATPMDLRLDAGVVAAECILEVERQARTAGNGTVGTVGRVSFDPGIINVVPGVAELSLDVRGVSDGLVKQTAEAVVEFAKGAAGNRGLTASYAERMRMGVTALDPALVQVLEEEAEASGEPYLRMHSGAAHDTMCVAAHAPAAMIFVPCKDGVSHSPAEEASCDDAAVAAEIMLRTISRVVGDGDV